MDTTKRVSAIVLLSSLLSWAGVEKTTVTVSDVSPPQQLVSFGGTVSLSQESQETSARQESMRLKEEGTVTVRNIAGKSALALVLTIKTATSEMRYSHDFFFKKGGLAPEETFDIPIGGGLTFTFNAMTTKARADAELRFIQFDDGSTWGDKAAAESLIADRARVEVYLRGLLAAYTDQGERGLVSALRTPPHLHSSAYEVYQRLMRMQKESGTAATLEGIRTRLKVAADREATGKF